MSKNSNKGKDKKQSDSSQTDKVYDLQRRQLHEKDRTVKQLEYQITHLTKENHRITSEMSEINKRADKKIEFLHLNIQTLEDRLKNVYSAKAQLQIRSSNHELKIKKLQKSNQNLESLREKEQEEFQKKMSYEIQKYENHFSEYQTSINEFSKVSGENKQLKDELVDERGDRIRVLADKDRERIQSMDIFKREMLENNNKMKMNLLNMRRDQMATNIRLTVLQNNQLVQELQFQSRNTEKILDKNSDLELIVKQLAKEIEIEKELQVQIANRTTISKAIISKLHAKNEQLEVDASCFENRLAQEQTRIIEELTEQHSEAIEHITDRLRGIEAKLGQSQLKNSQLQVLHDASLTELKKYEESAENLVNTMLRYYEDIMDGTICVDEGDYVYDLTRLKELDVNLWKSEDCKITVQILLNLLKSRLSEKKLEVPYLKKVLITRDEQAIKRASRSSYMSLANRSKPFCSQKMSSFEDNDLKKRRNLSELGRKILGSCSLFKAKSSSIMVGDPGKENCLSGKIVRSNMREWGKSPKPQQPASVISRFHRNR